jgi:hypothetical protein
VKRTWLAAVALLPLAAAACGGSRRTSSGATPVRGQYTAQVQGYLARLATNSRAQGYTRSVAGPVYGNLRDDGIATHDMTVASGVDYALIGACDNDCTDVDLKISDTAGNVIMQDIAVDDTPVLIFHSNSAGKWRVQVIMATCSRNPCYYGIQLLAR